MATEDITLRVSPEAAEGYREATPREQLKLEALVSFQLLGYLQPRRSLDDLITEMSRQAQERGLTPKCSMNSCASKDEHACVRFSAAKRMM